MAKVLVFGEFSGTGIKKGTLELVTAAIAGKCEVAVCLFGPGAKALAPNLGQYGVKQVLISEHASLSQYNPEIFMSALTAAIDKFGPDTLLATASMLARDLLPRVAAKRAGLASDCTELSFDGSGPVVRKPLYAGKCSARVQFGSSALKVILMRANQLPVAAPGSGSAQVTELTLNPVDAKTQIKEVVKGKTAQLDLTEANVIVSGGRGMKGPEHFKLLEELADVLHATVGASRAVADAGWVPHSMQVGQTGKTVAPSLYIACGISGAIQHLAGMSGSKVIVAVNKDPDAPIFQKATYGIVGDIFEVLPKLTEACKKLLHH